MQFNSTLLVIEQNDKEKYVYADTELHLMEKVSGVLVIIFGVITFGVDNNL